jgi:NhaP-type Na+/H+ or K+/H+ antiporter
MLELGSVIILGILAQWLAWRIKVPAILPLLIIGLVVGPLSTLWTEDGQKLLEPMWNGQKGLFAGEHLFHFVELSIGLILFEGGMSLKREELRGVGPSIINLITLGSLVTFTGGALLVYFLLGLPLDIAFLFSALIIVTGPTVIGPILRNLNIKRNVSAILKWEGILIDPIGALVAVLVYEFIYLFHSPEFGGGGNEFTSMAIRQFFTIALEGLSLGFLMAHALKFLLKRNLVPHYLLTVFTLSFVLAVFVGSHYLVADSGLLTVVVLGMVIGNIDIPHKKEIAYFGESISILLIAVLFILLSANIDIDDLMLLRDWRVLALFLSIILVLRPIAVFLSTRTSGMPVRDKMFISWVGPRGIVAAGIASLFGSKLVSKGVFGAEYITPLVFMVVLGTVILNATTAGLLARLTGVLLAKSNGILILGAHRASRLIASYLIKNDRHVVLVDSNSGNIEKSQEMGIDSFQTNIYSDELKDNSDLNDVGFLLAMTGSTEVNKYALDTFSKEFGENGAYRLISVNELQNPDTIEEECLFSDNDDFINLLEVARDYPNIYEYEIKSVEDLAIILKDMHTEEKIVPLFIKELATGDFRVVTSDFSKVQAVAGDLLVYMGKEYSSANNTAEIAG